MWWMLAPVLVALLFGSVVTFLLKNRKPEAIRIEQQKSKYLKNYPRFLDLNKVRRKKVLPKVSRAKRLGEMTLLACYAEKNKKFIVFKEAGKTVFLDLGERYKSAKLLDVGLDYAIFSKNGKKIELKLEDKKKINQIKRVMQQASQQDRYISVKREDLKKYTKNIRQALRDVRIQELKEKKKFIGIRLSFIRRGSLFDRMKLKVGDVIKSIDGNELKSMMDLLPYYNRINDTATVQVGFERNNEMKEIVYEIN